MFIFLCKSPTSPNPFDQSRRGTIHQDPATEHPTDPKETFLGQCQSGEIVYHLCRIEPDPLQIPGEILAGGDLVGGPIEVFLGEFKTRDCNGSARFQKSSNAANSPSKRVQTPAKLGSCFEVIDNLLLDLRAAIRHRSRQSRRSQSGIRWKVRRCSESDVTRVALAELGHQIRHSISSNLPNLAGLFWCEGW